MDEEEYVIQRIEFTETPQKFLKSFLKQSQAEKAVAVEVKKEAVIEEKKVVKTRETKRAETVAEPKKVIK